jgi:hypothetical protein
VWDCFDFLFDFCSFLVFVSWSFVLCFIFLLWNSLWLSEEVLTFLNHENGDFSILRRDILLKQRSSLMLKP